MNNRTVGVYGFENSGVLREFAQGAANQGYQVVWRRHDVFTPDQKENLGYVIVNGLRKHYRTIKETYQKLGVPVIVTDLGHVNRGYGYYQVGLGQLGWIPEFKCPQDRFKKLDVPYKGNKAREGGYILLCGQMPDDAAHNMNEMQLQDFYQQKVAEIRRYTKRNIIWRPHPDRKISLYGVDGVSEGEELSKALEGAFAVVAHNSTSGIEALIAGVPVFASPTAFYWDLGNSDLSQIDSPSYPTKAEYESFMSRLAYAQWTLEEIREGLPMKFLADSLVGITPEPKEADNVKENDSNQFNEQSKDAIFSEENPADKESGSQSTVQGQQKVVGRGNGRFTPKKKN